MALIECPECGKEISDKASNCPNCGCPINTTEDNISEQPQLTHISPKVQNVDIKKFLPIIAIVAIVAIAGVFLYNLKVVQPRNKYEEATALLEEGKYQEGKEILETIKGYKDTDKILEQIKWESIACECITDLAQYLKNPDSLQIHEIVFYSGEKEDINEDLKVLKNRMKNLIDKTKERPVCLIYSSAQNGLGGNSSSYSIFEYQESSYKYIGSCDTLDEDEINRDGDDYPTYLVIKLCHGTLEKVGDVDLSRIKTIIKNDAYSSVTAIE